MPWEMSPLRLIWIIDPGFCGGCWWITQSWMNQCPRDFDTARCMTEQPPEAVAGAILRELAATAPPVEATGASGSPLPAGL